MLALTVQQTRVGSYEAVDERKLSIYEKISAFVKNIFEKIIEFFSFPLRYIGSKGAGYHAEIQKTLTPEESLPYLKHAAMAACQHGCDEEWINPFGLHFYDPLENSFDLSSLPGKLETRKNCFYDSTTGLKITIAMGDNDEVLVGFGALDSARALYPDQPKIHTALKKNQYGYIAKGLLGAQPACYAQADAFFRVFKTHPDFRGKTVSLAGQCLGGSIAQYVALKNEVPLIAFNTLPLGAGLQQAIGPAAFEKADELITHISAQTDFVSDNRYLAVWDRALWSVGICTPGNFGKHYDIPAAYTIRDEIHDYMMGSLMKHVGYTNRSKTNDLTSQQVEIAKKFRPQVTC